MAKKKKQQDEFASGDDLMNQAGQGETGGNNASNQGDSGEKEGPEVIAQARYVGNSPVRVAQSEKTVMLWPNQVYKNLEMTEDVQALLKRRKLQNI